MGRYRRKSRSRDVARKHREWMPLAVSSVIDEAAWTKDGQPHMGAVELHGFPLTEDEGTIVRLRGELTLSWDFTVASTDFVHTLIGWLVSPELADNVNRNPYDPRDTDYLSITPYSCIISNATPRQTNAKEVDSKAKRRYEKNAELVCIAGFQYAIRSGQSVGLRIYFAGRALVEY